MNKEVTQEMLVELSRQLSDEGKLIEAGWVGLRIAAIPPNASETQIREMRRAFMAGAQHLFASINSILDSDREPTENDMRRMTLIHEELQAFVEELKSDMA